jgi:hypothetical protein
LPLLTSGTMKTLKESAGFEWLVSILAWFESFIKVVMYNISCITQRKR